MNKDNNDVIAGSTDLEDPKLRKLFQGGIQLPAADCNIN